MCLDGTEQAELAETVIGEVVARIRAYIEWRSEMPLPGDAAYHEKELLPVNGWSLNREAKRWLDQAHLPSSPHLPYLVQLLWEGFEANLAVPGGAKGIGTIWN